MLGYILRRLGVAVVLLFLLSVITFAVYLKVPANPAGFLVDVQHSSPQQIAEAQHRLGTDRPAVVQYVKYMQRALHGDFGISWATISFAFGGEPTGVPVGRMVWRAALVTGSLVARRLRPAPARRDPARDVRRDAPALVLRPADARHRGRRDLDAPARRRPPPAALRRQPLEARCPRPATAPSRSRRRPRSSRCAVRADRHAAPVRRRRAVGAGTWSCRGSRSRSSSSRSTCGSCAHGCSRCSTSRTSARRAPRARRSSRVIRSHALRNAIAPVVTMVGDGHRDGDRDRHVHRDGLRPAGARPHDDPRARRLRGLRPARDPRASRSSRRP